MALSYRIAAFFVILCTGCASKFTISEKKIKQNHRFEYGVWMEKITVDSTRTDGMPLKYKTDSIFSAVNLLSLSDEETVELLSGTNKEKFLRLKNVKDSFDRHNILEYRPADTIRTVKGSTTYTLAGLKRPVAYYHIKAEMDVVKYAIKMRPRKVIHFSKPNKYYRWRAGSATPTIPVRRIHFQPGSWYKIVQQCSYGLLASGTCTLFFSFNEKGKLLLYREDRVNDGPF